MAFEDQVGLEKIGDSVKGYWDLVCDTSPFSPFCKEEFVLFTNDESTSEVNFLWELYSDLVIEHPVWEIRYRVVVICFSQETTSNKAGGEETGKESFRDDCWFHLSAVAGKEIPEVC